MPKKAKRFRPFPHGLTICYIGNGKGKTTAAVGVAVRAAGYGMRVAFLQFFKSLEWPSGERESLTQLGVHVDVLGKGFVGILGDRKPVKEHKQAAKEALYKAELVLVEAKYDVVVLDEIISCVEVGILSQLDVVRLLRMHEKSLKLRKIHLVLTGHKKYPTILSHCDMVSEMQAVKHPYYKGFLAVKGIDF